MTGGRWSRSIARAGPSGRRSTTGSGEPPGENGPPRGRHGLARTSSGIAVLAAAGVLTGFAVDATIAALFGASAQTDAFFIAATIPFALASVLLASANQALVPLINSWFKDHGPDAAMERVGGLMGTSLVITTAVAASASPRADPPLDPCSGRLLGDEGVGLRDHRSAVRHRDHPRRRRGDPGALEREVLVRCSCLDADRREPHGPRDDLLLGRPPRRSCRGRRVRRGRDRPARIHVRRRAKKGLRVRPRVRFRDPRSGSRSAPPPPARRTGLNMIARAVERFLARSCLPAPSRS